MKDLSEWDVKESIIPSNVAENYEWDKKRLANKLEWCIKQYLHGNQWLPKRRSANTATANYED